MTDMTGITNPRVLSVIRTFIALPVIVVALVLGLLPGGAQAASPARDYRGFFTGTALAGSGWTTCSTPITWSIDVSALRPKQRRTEVKRVGQAMKQWARAARLTIRYTGREKLEVNPTFHTLNPRDGSATRDRHVYISFVREGQAPLMVDPVAGLAMPARVDSASGDVIGGVAMFRAKHVRNTRDVSARALRGLYLHELGHVFGLGHAEHQANVMYPLLGDYSKLGPGDTRGVRKMVKACRA